jgi:hypothetical protein
LFVKTSNNPGYLEAIKDNNKNELQTDVNKKSPQKITNLISSLDIDSPEKNTPLMNQESPYFRCSSEPF